MVNWLSVYRLLLSVSIALVSIAGVGGLISSARSQDAPTPTPTPEETLDEGTPEDDLPASDDPSMDTDPTFDDDPSMDADPTFDDDPSMDTDPTFEDEPTDMESPANPAPVEDESPASPDAEAPLEGSPDVVTDETYPRALW
ncbi:MAG: hypothetical protein ACFE0J_05550 [Elainellaceae cyanobacterium]